MSVIFFYNLSARHLLEGVADIIKLINKDELSHVRLFQKIIPLAKEHYGGKDKTIYDIFSKAVESEILWSRHICQSDKEEDKFILGVTSESIEQYTKYLANTRLRAIGLKPLYDNVKNPYKHLEKLSDASNEATTKTNFFEGTVTSYIQSTGIHGWDEI